MKTKIFDCVKMKDSIQKDIYKDIKNLAPEEQIAYYQNAVKEYPALKDKLAKIQQTKIAEDSI